MKTNMHKLGKKTGMPERSFKEGSLMKDGRTYKNDLLDTDMTSTTRKIIKLKSKN